MLAARAGVVVQRPGDDYIAFEAEEVDSLGGSGFVVVGLGTYTHPNPNGFTSSILPTDTNASRDSALLTHIGGSWGTLATYKIQFATAGTYRMYTRDGAYENGSDTSSYGNEDSFFAYPEFGADPGSSGATNAVMGTSGNYEGQYGWRPHSAHNYAVTTPGVYDLLIRSREGGFSLDRFVFSQTTNLSDGQLDALRNWDVTETHFTDGAAGDSNWETAGNWDAGVPNDVADAYVGAGNTAQLSAAGQEALHLTIGHDGDTLAGDGTVNQTGGDLTVHESLVIGLSANGATEEVNGSYLASGGSLTVGAPGSPRANLYVGRVTTSTEEDAVGTLDLSGASQFNAYLEEFEIGHRTVSGTQGEQGMAQGIVTLAQNNVIDARSILVSESQMYGTIPETELHLGGSNTIKTDEMVVAGFRGNALVDFAAAGGELNLTGSTGSEATLRVGYGHSGTGTPTDGVMNLSGGTFNATLDELVVAYRVARGKYDVVTTGELSFDDGEVRANTLVVGEGAVAGDGTEGQGQGTLNIGGGSLIVHETAQFGIGSSGSTAEINQTGGTFTVRGDVVNGVGTSTFNLTGGSMEVDGDFSADEVTIDGGSLTAGQILMTDGADNPTGGITLSDGLLAADSVDPGDGTATFSFTGGTLAVDTFGLDLLQQGGTLSPGNSIGTTTIDGNYELAGGDLFIEIDVDAGPGAAGGHDQLIVTGDVTLGGALTISLDYQPEIGTEFLILDKQSTGAISSFFDDLPEGARLGNTSGSFSSAFLISYLGGDGNDVVLHAVPEPGSLGLLAVAGLVLAGRRRGFRSWRRRKNRA